MANKLTVLTCSALLAGQLAAPASAWAQDDTFVPETLSAKERLDPGPKVFVNVQDWGGGPSFVRIYSADDLSIMGTADAGSQSHFAISGDGKTVYIISGYYSRLSSGTGEHVLRIFDTETATLTKEIQLPVKVSQYTDDASLMQLSADEKYLYVQNATPATSVIAFSGPGVPSNGTPRSRARGPASDAVAVIETISAASSGNAPDQNLCIEVMA